MAYYLRARGRPQTRPGGACVLRYVEHQDPLLNAHGVSSRALQKGDSYDWSADSTLLNDGAHDRPVREKSRQRLNPSKNRAVNEQLYLSLILGNMSPTRKSGLNRD